MGGARAGHPANRVPPAMGSMEGSLSLELEAATLNVLTFKQQKNAFEGGGFTTITLKFYSEDFEALLAAHRLKIR